MNRAQLTHYQRFGLPAPLAARYAFDGNDLKERATGRVYVPSDEKDDAIDELVRDGDPLSQRGMYDAAQQRYSNISLRDVRDALRKDIDYQQARQKKTRNGDAIQIKALYPLHLLQIDLVGIDKYPHANMQQNRFNYALTCIDVFSRHAWAVLIRKKEAPIVARAMASILDDIDRKPSVVQSDNGLEFKNKNMGPMLEQRGINQIFSSPYSPTTQGYVERFHRTLRRSLELYFEKNEDEMSQDLIDRFLERYNNTVHSGTRMKPADKIREQGPRRRNANPVVNVDGEFQVGDLVRVSLSVLDKNHRRDANAKLTRQTRNWSADTFTVTKVIAGRSKKPVYKVRHEDGGVLPGSLQEFQLIRAY